MSRDFPAQAAFEACSRAGKILPVLDSWLVSEGHPPLTEVQRVGLATVILAVFDGLTETLERMGHADAVLERFADDVSFADTVERWLASRDDEGKLH